MNYWISWYQNTEDYRPLNSPPNEQILGWWNTGVNGDDLNIICALVSAESEAAATEAILKEWPEATEYKWRFFDEKLYTPMEDRFPREEWMVERIAQAFPNTEY
jgi:hypothetical protein